MLSFLFDGDNVNCKLKKTLEAISSDLVGNMLEHVWEVLNAFVDLSTHIQKNTFFGSDI